MRTAHDGRLASCSNREVVILAIQHRHICGKSLLDQALAGLVDAAGFLVHVCLLDAEPFENLADGSVYS